MSWLSWRNRLSNRSGLCCCTGLNDGSLLDGAAWRLLPLSLLDESLQLFRLLRAQLPQSIWRHPGCAWLSRLPGLSELHGNGHPRLLRTHRYDLRRWLRGRLWRRGCFNSNGFSVGGFVLSAYQTGDACREKQGEAEVGHPVGSARFVRTEFGSGFVVEVIVGVVMAGGCIRVGVVRSAHGRRRCPTSGAKSMGAARSMAQMFNLEATIRGERDVR